MAENWYQHRAMVYSNFWELGIQLFLAYIVFMEIPGYTRDEIAVLRDPTVGDNESKNGIEKDKFNFSPRNWWQSGAGVAPKKEGQKVCNLILFHPLVTEGVSLMDCGECFILEPILEAAKAAQVEARALRLDSHAQAKASMPPGVDPEVQIYMMSIGEGVKQGYYSASQANVKAMAVDADYVIGTHDDASIRPQDQNVVEAAKNNEENNDAFTHILTEYAMDRK